MAQYLLKLTVVTLQLKAFFFDYNFGHMTQRLIHLEVEFQKYVNIDVGTPVIYGLFFV